MNSSSVSQPLLCSAKLHHEAFWMLRKTLLASSSCSQKLTRIYSSSSLQNLTAYILYEKQHFRTSNTPVLVLLQLTLDRIFLIFSSIQNDQIYPGNNLRGLSLHCLLVSILSFYQNSNPESFLPTLSTNIDSLSNIIALLLCNIAVKKPIYRYIPPDNDWILNWPILKLWSPHKSRS